MTDLTQLDDADLVARIATQDRAAFAELFSRFAVRVKAFMLRSGASPQDADEIAQDVLVSVWRRADSFNPDKAAVSTWIFAIARNRRIDLLRKHARPAPDPNDPLFQPDPEPDGQAAMSQRQMQERVRIALQDLPDEQRHVLHASFYDGLSHGEISIELSLPLGTVKSRIRLAFKQLRGVLGDEWMEGISDD